MNTAASSAATSPSRPVIYLGPTNSRAYRYACMIWDGYTPKEAARLVGVSYRMAQDYQAEAKAAAQAIEGRPVTYLFALRLVFCPER